MPWKPHQGLSYQNHAVRSKALVTQFIRGKSCASVVSLSIPMVRTFEGWSSRCWMSGERTSFMCSFHLLAALPRSPSPVKTPCGRLSGRTYKLRQQPLTFEGNEIWVNADLSHGERTQSRKVRAVMDLLSEVGPSEKLKPKWSTAQVLRVTAGQERDGLCTVNAAENLITLEPLSDNVLIPTQKMQLEVSFDEQVRST